MMAGIISIVVSGWNNCRNPSPKIDLAKIQFDDKGKRIGTPVFMEMKNGILVISEKN